MYNEPLSINNRNEAIISPELKTQKPVNIKLFLEEGNLQKLFFSGQITPEEYRKKKKILKIV